MGNRSAKKYLDLAKSHLKRVQVAWYEPTDWTDLSTYGFYCLEAAVMAATAGLGWSIRRSHVDKAQAARRLAKEFNLPQIDDLLSDLNSARKSASYGDVPFPDLHAEDVAVAVEQYVDAVADLIKRRGK
jgi:stalled ribosome rescue protein Dom34